MMWIEMSRDEVHGGGDWAFAKCVWSPTHKNNKKRNQTWLFWENVKKVKEGDSIEEQIDHVERCVPTSEALAQLKNELDMKNLQKMSGKIMEIIAVFPIAMSLIIIF